MKREILQRWRCEPIMHNTALFPIVTMVRNYVNIYNSVFVSASFPMLTYIGGGGANYDSFYFVNNAALTHLPLLNYIGSGYDTLYIDINPVLTLVSLPKLTSLGSPTSAGYSLYININPVLTSVWLPSLSVIGGCSGCAAIQISNNADLTLIWVPSLTYIGPSVINLFSNNALFTEPSIIYPYSGTCYTAAPPNAAQPSAATVC